MPTTPHSRYIYGVSLLRQVPCDRVSQHVARARGFGARSSSRAARPPAMGAGRTLCVAGCGSAVGIAHPDQRRRFGRRGRPRVGWSAGVEPCHLAAAAWASSMTIGESPGEAGPTHCLQPLAWHAPQQCGRSGRPIRTAVPPPGCDPDLLMTTCSACSAPGCAADARGGALQAARVGQTKPPKPHHGLRAEPSGQAL